ncbi:MAG: toxin HipA [Deltaproteobacteria bacterium HGW-Deltaproteobacteria-17]|nr:MAG: toxin HipA [Deltaproteobacteria bacterium HGW-Deltaproteobacteria-17]
MTALAEVRLWGTRIGAVHLPPGSQTAIFEYDPAFAGSGIEVSPLVMPLARRAYTFPGLPRAAFHGLPGLLADSLPDRFGNALIDAWLASQGRAPESFSAVERLCYTGSRGTGALEFVPAAGPEPGRSEVIEVAELVRLASSILGARQDLKVTFSGDGQEQALRHLLAVGTSAGGARAKAVIAWNPSTGEVRSGQVAADGFEYWLLKFDGVAANRDRELADPAGYGAVEYAYHLMARAAGIEMEDCRLLEENGRRHFMTRRFDRLAGGDKLHMQSLAALAHLDFNAAGAHSYEQAFLAMRRLGLPMAQLEEQFRRMVFNVSARNQDDHVKNIAFLMDRRGRWRLSPAFDVTYAFNPRGDWTFRHQMSLHGKREAFVRDDLLAAAETASLARSRAVHIIGQVTGAVAAWPDFARSAGVAEAWIADIAGNLITEL